MLGLFGFYNSRPNPTKPQPQPQPWPWNPYPPTPGYPKATRVRLPRVFSVKASCCRPTSQVHAVCVPLLSCRWCQNSRFLQRGGNFTKIVCSPEFYVPDTSGKICRTQIYAERTANTRNVNTDKAPRAELSASLEFEIRLLTPRNYAYSESSRCVATCVGVFAKKCVNNSRRIHWESPQECALCIAWNACRDQQPGHA